MKNWRMDWWKKVKGRVEKESPPWLFALLVSLYSWLHPRKRKFLAFHLPPFWLIVDRNYKLLAPSETNGLPSFAEAGGVYWEYCDKGFEVERGDVVLDVGAWVGDFTLRAALRAGKEGRVIAVEPHPSNLLLLRYNVSKLRNVEVVGKALWKQKGRVRLFLGNSSTKHFLDGREKHLRERGAYIWVETETLDGLVSRFGLKRVDFLKMDVEGAELKILQAGRRTLKLTRKVAIAAYHTKKGKPTWERIQEILEKHGFRTQVTENYIVRGWKHKPEGIERLADKAV